MSTSRLADLKTTAEAIAAQFARVEAVEAVALGGSVATGRANHLSDIDLYVYCREDVPVEARAEIIRERASHFELAAPYWETEDYWLEKSSKVKVEAVYRNDWLRKALEDMFEHSRAQMGFSTCLWHNVKTSRPLFDRSGYFASLQALTDVPYPEALAEAIIAKNFPLLRGSLVEHPNQLTAAVERGDSVFVVNLLYMIFNSYFDILFALNRELHPGAKRQLDYAKHLPLRPENMTEDVTELTNCDQTKVVAQVTGLVDRLETLLVEQEVRLGS